MSASDAAKRLHREAKARLRQDPHIEHYASLDVDYLYRLALERQSALGKALTGDGDAEAPIDEAYIKRVWAAAADAANALAFLADRVTPHRGRIQPSSEALGAKPGEPR